MAEKKPEWLTECEGFIDVTLAAPATISGAQVSAVRMREPTVNDQLVASKAKGSDAEQEIAMMANLCELAPADIQALTLKNYRRLQTAFIRFTE